MNKHLSLQYVNGRHTTFRCCFHWTFLCIHGDLAKSILLSIWISFLGLLYIGCELRSNFHRYDIFSIMWWSKFFFLSNCHSKENIKALFLSFFLQIFQDYRWWWRSFIISGGSAAYIFLYSIFYFFTKLSITEFIPTLLYLSYTGKIIYKVFIYNRDKPIGIDLLNIHNFFLKKRSNGSHFLAAHRINWIFRSIQFRTKNIWSC